ncbi:hypothetical protein ACP275_01G101700 [Erythranthe tilingii]
MECKLCYKKFINGKALGGHMRSHYATLPLPPKTPQRQELSEPPPPPPPPPSSESTSSEERESSTGEKSSLSYGLRGNPKKSYRLVDPEFYDVGSDASETESTRVRSKRAKVTTEAAPTELGIEEELALCLVMLSKDVWASSTESRTSQKVHRCESCDRVFKSSQGLGSHRASHNKTTTKNTISSSDDYDGGCEKKPEIAAAAAAAAYKCSFCDKIFGSYQALGGHKRSHYFPSKDKIEEPAAIDLNIPASMEDEEDEEGCWTSSICLIQLH